MSTDDPNNPDPKNKVAVDFIMANTINGVVINGLLIWMDIQNQTTPPAIWKAQLIELFTDEEILEAKKALFDTVGGTGTRIGIFENHPKKKSLHAEDLVTAMKKLWDAGEAPLLLGTSKMMRTTRIYNVEKENETNISDVLNRVKLLESGLNKMYEEQSKEMKTLADLIGATGQGGSNVMVKEPAGAAGGVPTDSHVSFPPLNQSVNRIRKESVGAQHRTQSPKRRRAESESGDSFYSVIDDTQGRGQWAEVASRKPEQENPENQGKFKVSWKKKLNILHGTSRKNDVCDSFAADVSLVAHGLAKDATEERLKAYLVGKDLNVVSCELMTKFVAESRALTFKVTIKAKDLEKAKNPELWPSRVGVRMFKHFSTKPKSQEKLSFDKQINSDKAAHDVRNVSKVQPKDVMEQGIPLTNRFTALTADVQDFVF